MSSDKHNCGFCLPQLFFLRALFRFILPHLTLFVTTSPKKAFFFSFSKSAQTELNLKVFCALKKLFENALEKVFLVKRCWSKFLLCSVQSVFFFFNTIFRIPTVQCSLCELQPQSALFSHGKQKRNVTDPQGQTVPAGCDVTTQKPHKNGCNICSRNNRIKASGKYLPFVWDYAARGCCLSSGLAVSSFVSLTRV